MEKEEKKTENKYILKESLKTFKNNFAYTLQCGAFISLVILILYLISSLILNSNNFFNSTFGIILFLVTIFLIVIILSPFIYSYFMCNFMLSSPLKDSVRFRSFLKTSALGLNRPQRGTLSVFYNLTRSLIVYILVMSVLEVIVFLVLSQTNPTVFELIQDYVSGRGISNEELNIINEALLEPLMICNYFVLLISIGMYLHFMLIYVFKYHLNTLFFYGNRKILNNIFKLTIKKNRKDFYSGYFMHSWPIYVIFVIAFTLSYFLFFYLTNVDNLVLISLTALCISLFLIIPFFPLVFNYYGLKINDYQFKFGAEYVTLGRSFLNEIKESKNNDPLLKEYCEKMDEEFSFWEDGIKNKGFEKDKEQEHLDIFFGHLNMEEKVKESSKKKDKDENKNDDDSNNNDDLNNK